MKKEELQQLMNAGMANGFTRAQMLEIAKCYLRGDVLKDPVAAEAWLMRVMDSGDFPEAVQATALLAREILGKNVPISKEDYADLRHALESAGGSEREAIVEWMKLYESQNAES